MTKVGRRLLAGLVLSGLGGGSLFLGNQYEGVNYATATCTTVGITDRIKKMVSEMKSPSTRPMKLLKFNNFRDNPDFGTGEPTHGLNHYMGMSITKAMNEAWNEAMTDREHRCIGDAITNHGEMDIYYDWKQKNDTWYLLVSQRPKVDD